MGREQYNQVTCDNGSTRIVDTHQLIEHERTEVDTAQGMMKESKKGE